MKKVTGIVLFFLAAMFFSVFFSNLKAQSLTPEEFQKRLEKENGVLIDARTPEEFQAERIKGAINININDPEFSEKIKGLDKTRSYFIYCRVGRRSAKALGIFKESGFKKVYHLGEGIEGWKKRGLPTQKH